MGGISFTPNLMVITRSDKSMVFMVSLGKVIAPLPSKPKRVKV